MAKNWKPEGPVTHIEVRSFDPNRKFPAGYEPEARYALTGSDVGKFYERARVEISPEREPVVMQEQHAEYNAAKRPCPRCKGRGAIRMDRGVGCSVCYGVGAVNK